MGRDIICAVTIDRHGVPHRTKALSALKQRPDLLKITRDIFNPPAHQANPVGVIPSRDFIVSPPRAHVELRQLLHISQLTQRVVDSS
jgi:hypothetical protein